MVFGSCAPVITHSEWVHLFSSLSLYCLIFHSLVLLLLLYFLGLVSYSLTCIINYIHSFDAIHATVRSILFHRVSLIPVAVQMNTNISYNSLQWLGEVK